VLAAACYAAASRAGLRIGPDLPVTGSDGSALSRILAPALTTMAMPLADIATRLIDRVIAEAAGTPQDGGEVIGAPLSAGRASNLVMRRTGRPRHARRQIWPLPSN
jgi:DNA-binding LacI/PurR family transcriptional regulator